MTTYFITGANGFIGSYLAKELLQRGEKVIATRRNRKMSTFWDEESYQKVEWVDVDILDATALVSATKGVDRLIHAAAFVSLDNSKVKLLHKTNVEGTANVVNACLANQIPLSCFVSSIAALGTPKGKSLIDED
ncbi:MAG: SDR family NAD(P)-dependent oxidoreductase, partial [Flammeovirgaceae bacterium]|nr:SDR family NAD(P)-dependent oxidoreductase [Flammeovirgaceae bacterium]MDW8288448.1 SDR family NAD(P)-dependent oxidoreductase [Flammeovirgaceae bacterium]